MTRSRTLLLGLVAGCFGLLIPCQEMAVAIAQETQAQEAQAPAATAGPSSADDQLAIEQPAGTDAAEATVPPPGSAPGEVGAVDLPATAPILADVAELFVRANTHYEEGRHGAAIDLYLQVIEGGSGTGQVHFNLGNAYLRGGELGRAIASYLRSQALRPRDEDVQANLAFARKSSRDAVAPPQPAPALETLFFWHYSLSVREKVELAVVLSAIFWGLLAVRLWRRRSEVLRVSSYLVLFLLLAVGGSLAWRFFLPERVAVVVPPEVSGLAAPAADSLALFSLHSGTELRVTETRTDWLRVRLPDGRSGWLPREQAAFIVR